MEAKTYFANSVSAAMATARRELGAEALLVDSKPAPAAARQFGPLEVTFARSGGGGGLEEIRRDIAALRAELVRQPQGPVPVAAWSGGAKTVAFVGPAGRGKT